MKIALLAALLLLGSATAHAQPATTAHAEAHVKDGKATASASVTPTPASPKPAIALPAPAAKPADASKAPPAPAKSPPKPTQTHRAHKYERVLVGFHNNLELANAIDRSLKDHSDGNGLITPDRCQPNGDSCGTPNMLVYLYTKSAPKAAAMGKITLAKLSTFVRSAVLIPNPDPPGAQRWMGCIVRATHKPLWNCMTRPFDPEEKVYADAETHEPFTQTNCENGIGDVVPELECAELHFFMHATEEAHVGPEVGKIDDQNDVCRPALKRPGETEFESTLLDECPRTNCLADWFSFEALAPGEYVLRLPKRVAYSDVVLRLCLLFADGTQTLPTRVTKSAYTTLWRAYVDFPDKEMSMESRQRINWIGLVHTWQMSSERAYVGPRPPPDGLPK